MSSLSLPNPAAPRLYPTLRCRDAASLIGWLVDAFGFTVIARHETDGVVAHAELAFGPSIIMLGQHAGDAYGSIVGAPGAPGGRSVYVAVDDADAAFSRAVAAGAEIAEPLTDRPYGSREFICRDPEGNVWCFGTYRPAAG